MIKNKNIKDAIYVACVSFIPIFILYLPFILNLKHFFFLTIKEPGFFNIFKNWDGPNYLMVSRTFYNLADIDKRLFIPGDPKYFSAHLPLYPALIYLLSFFIISPYAGLIINLLFGYFLNLLFFNIAKKYSSQPLLLTLIFTIFPARFLVLRSIISPESMLLFFILLSLYYFDIKNIFMASVIGSLAVFTKIQALFLFPVYLAVIIEKKIIIKSNFLKKTVSKYHQLISHKIRSNYLWIILIPLAFILISFFYYLRTGDFFAYIFAQSRNNLSLSMPYAQFNYQSIWGGSVWMEDILFYFLLILILILSLSKSKNRMWFYFCLFYGVFLFFIPHRDISRYAFPISPFFMLHFEKILTSKYFKIALLILLPAIYLYAINFMLINQAPIADWSKLIN